ncbi:unnamed protein product [Closterium sp. NIES-64]|nr:unnamed protein product [Closterium sp. NIES-64]
MYSGRFREFSNSHRSLDILLPSPPVYSSTPHSSPLILSHPFFPPFHSMHCIHLHRTSPRELSNNAISGPIPAALGGLASLTNLDLSNNNLSGAIPPSIDNLVSLITLYVLPSLRALLSPPCMPSSPGAPPPPWTYTPLCTPSPSSSLSKWSFLSIKQRRNMQAKEGRTHAVTKAGIGRKNEVYTENNSRALHATRPRRGVESDLWGVDLAEEIQIWEETIHMKIDGVRREGKIIEKNGGV